MSNPEWIERARMGDVEAFNQLVLANQDRIFNQAYRLMGDPQSAEDLTQEAFLSAYLKLSQFRGGSFQAWMLRIVTNLCYDELRIQKRHPMLALEPLGKDGEELESPYWMMDQSPFPEELAERSELREKLQRCLDQISIEFRTAVVLVDIQGLDYSEAAGIMGTSIGTLKSRLARGRMKLSEIWKAQTETSQSRSIHPVRSAVSGKNTFGSFTSLALA